MNKDWLHTKLGDIAKITCGIAATPEYVDESVGVPFLSARNVQDGKLDLSKFMYISKELHIKLTKNTKPKKGDVLLTRVGAGIGKAAFVDIGFEFSVYVSLTLIQCKGMLDGNFLTFVLNTNYYQYLANRDQFAGGGVQNLNVQMVKNYPVSIPPLPEQIKIAEILSTWDNAINTVQKLLANSQQQKKALMQQLLTGKKRFAGFEGEWEDTKLDDLFSFKRGKGLSKDELFSTGKYKCVLYGELYTKYDEVIKTVISRTNATESVKSIFGDILIPSSTTTTGIDLAKAVAILEDDVFLGGDINILRRKNSSLCSVFMAYLLTHIKKYEIAAYAQGITIIHLYGSDIKKIRVSIPSLPEQQKIAAVLTTADQEIDNLRAQLSRLEKEKKALMQQLLTGKRRVKVEEAA